MLSYENQPGASGTPPPDWPSKTRLARRHDRYTLVMFAHPDCPCTRASLAQIESLMPRLQGRLDVFIQFRKPGISLRDAQASDLWKTAAAIPGVSVLLDPDGGEVREFGAEVSGQTVLYSPNGKLIFTGGITASRGHIGDSPGLTAVLLGVNGAEGLVKALVFGCSLRDPGSAEITKDSSWSRR